MASDPTVQVVQPAKMVIQVVDGGTVVSVIDTKIAVLEIVNTGPQGAQGPIGLTGPAGQNSAVSVNLATYEFISVDGNANVLIMPHVIVAIVGLFVNGLLQSPSGYTISGTDLNIPTGLLWSGADCVFQYLF